MSTNRDAMVNCWSVWARLLRSMAREEITPMIVTMMIAPTAAAPATRVRRETVRRRRFPGRCDVIANSLGRSQHESDAADRVQQPWRAFDLQLAPQVSDEDID